MTSDTTRCPFIHLPSQYKFTEVDHKYPEVQHAPLSADPPSLGPLEQFQGSWTGVGFNTIFRPNNSVSGQNTTFTNPIVVPEGLGNGFATSNVLELNVTKEQIAFTQNNNISNVPNRGSRKQGDIFLAGVAYFQVISDMLNSKTFKADNPCPEVIHLEPGLWMAVPASSQPSESPSITRMGSIPHGTTINCAQSAPVTVVSGPPSIDPVTLVPAGLNLFTQFSLDVDNQKTPRIPQDLSQYKDAGTITQDMLSDPSSVLRNANIGLNILETTTINVAANIAQPSSTDVGNGIVNIPFLDVHGTGLDAFPNASVRSFKCTFWIEKVQYTLTVPPCKAGQTVDVTPPVPNPGSPPVTFAVTPATDITVDTQVTAESFQLQYRQEVMLFFSGFLWPHVSVGTLVPDKPVMVPSSVFA